MLLLQHFLDSHKLTLLCYYITATQQQIRNGTVIRESKVEFFEFEHDGEHMARQDSFEVLPGDSFRTSCYFETDRDDLIFGSGSDDEMCSVSFVYYNEARLLSGLYPWVCIYDIPLLSACNASVTHTKQIDLAEMRSFGKAPDQCIAEKTSSAASVTSHWVALSAVMISVLQSVWLGVL